MAEILLKASTPTNVSPEQEASIYKAGMPVVVMPDGHPWGTAERLPLFCLIKLPGVSIVAVLKYIEEARSGGNLKRRRIWQFALNGMPANARNKLLTVGELTIKVGAAYTGEYDYTWQQVRNYLKNLDTGLTESGEL